MSRTPAALFALTALAACATTQGAQSGAQRTSADASQTSRQRSAERQADARRQDRDGRDSEGLRTGDDRQLQERARSPRVDRQARARIVHEDMLTQMAFWAGEYDTFPNDLEAAQKFADVLRKGGRHDRAAQVAGEAAQRFPDDTNLLMTLGLAQIESAHPQDALRPLALVAHANAQDWRSRSALGAALDQLGRFDEARRAYQEALNLHPNDPAILTNMGVSHILAREPDQAEPILRQAAALPGAPPEARQNLAIALALQGRFDEAEQLERIDLPPQMVAENMSYLRSLLSDPRRWADVRRN